MERLYKSNKNKILAGVIGGIGEQLNIDPVILRLVWIIITAFTGFIPGIVVYLIAACIVPEKSKEIS